jgi:hypothetical protein
MQCVERCIRPRKINVVGYSANSELEVWDTILVSKLALYPTTLIEN